MAPGVNVVKLFFITNERTKKLERFVHGKPFHPILIFVSSKVYPTARCFPLG
jgi:hypothetical protein